MYKRNLSYSVFLLQIEKISRFRYDTEKRIENTAFFQTASYHARHDARKKVSLIFIFRDMRSRYTCCQSHERRFLNPYVQAI